MTVDITILHFGLRCGAKAYYVSITIHFYFKRPMIQNLYNTFQNYAASNMAANIFVNCYTSKLGSNQRNIRKNLVNFGKYTYILISRRKIDCKTRRDYAYYIISILVVQCI